MVGEVGRKTSTALLLVALGILSLMPACEPDEVTDDRAVETTETPSPSPSRTRSTDAVLRCRGHEAVEASVDGDSLPDLVFSGLDRRQPTVGVCTGAGSYSDLPALGMGESLYVADVQDDGTDEILFGATSLLMEYIQFAVWKGNGLRVVSLPDGDPLQVHFGAQFPEEQPFTFYRTTCERTRLPYVQGDVVEVTTVRAGDVFRWHATEYSIHGARASIIGEPRGASDVRGRSISGFGDELFVRCAPPNR